MDPRLHRGARGEPEREAPAASLQQFDARDGQAKASPAKRQRETLRLGLARGARGARGDSKGRRQVDRESDRVLQAQDGE